MKQLSKQILHIKENLNIIINIMLELFTVKTAKIANEGKVQICFSTLKCIILHKTYTVRQLFYISFLVKDWHFLKVE